MRDELNAYRHELIPATTTTDERGSGDVIPSQRLTD
jgi:hypothetical protein